MKRPKKEINHLMLPDYEDATEKEKTPNNITANNFIKLQFRFYSAHPKVLVD